MRNCELEGQVEGLESAARGRPVDLNAADMRMARSTTGGFEQILQLGPGALGDELDGAVVPIPNPAPQPQTVGLSNEEVPKSDPLHIAPDDAVQALHSREVIWCPHAGFRAVALQLVHRGHR